MKIDIPELNEVLDRIPELKNTRVYFRKDKFVAPLTLTTKPSLFSLIFLRKPYYLITINMRKNAPHFFDLTYEQKIGILAHELHHVLDYENMSKFELLLFLLKYITPKGRQKIEKQIDYNTAKHGFKNELIA